MLLLSLKDQQKKKAETQTQVFLAGLKKNLFSLNTKTSYYSFSFVSCFLVSALSAVVSICYHC